MCAAQQFKRKKIEEDEFTMTNQPSSIGKVVDIGTLDEEIQDMIKKSAEVMKQAYAPLSNFYVGSAVLCEDGSIFKGCNVENCSHSSICAERNAITTAVSEGHRKFKAIAVSAESNTFCAPCGNCRQFIVEFGLTTQIYLKVPSKRQVLVTNIHELLPLCFTPQFLKENTTNKS